MQNYCITIKKSGFRVPSVKGIKSVLIAPDNIYIIHKILLVCVQKIKNFNGLFTLSSSLL